MGTFSGLTIGLLSALVAAGVAQQTTATPPLSKVLPIPQDVTADSYQIYSELLPGREIEWGDVPRTFWLMEEATKAEPLDSPCATGGMMNPHKAIRPPQP